MSKKNRMVRTKPNSRRGGAVIELALMLPWILGLFLGVVDFGFYGYAVINIQNAARVAAMQTSAATSSAADSDLACTLARAEMGSLSNLGGIASCSSLPLIVTASSVSGAQSPDGAAASLVAVTYQTPQLIPFPGMTGRLTLTRTAQVRVRN